MANQYSVNHNKSANRFEVVLPEGEAILIYSIRAGFFILLHTEVPPAYEGRGIAALLTRTALEFAREQNLKVRSFCGFATNYIARHPEYKELMD